MPARVITDIPADSLRALAALVDTMREPHWQPDLAAGALRDLARYAPAGQRVRFWIEWEIESDRDREVNLARRTILAIVKADTREFVTIDVCDTEQELADAHAAIRDGYTCEVFELIERGASEPDDRFTHEHPDSGEVAR